MIAMSHGSGRDQNITLVAIILKSKNDTSTRVICFWEKYSIFKYTNLSIYIKITLRMSVKQDIYYILNIYLSNCIFVPIYIYIHNRYTLH